MNGNLRIPVREFVPSPDRLIVAASIADCISPCNASLAGREEAEANIAFQENRSVSSCPERWGAVRWQTVRRRSSVAGFRSQPKGSSMRVISQLVHAFPIVSAVAVALTFAGDALAGVSNPNTYSLNLDTGEDSIWLGPTQQFALMDSTSVIDFDVDSAGDMSNFTSSFPVSATTMSIGLNPVSAQLQLDDANSSGHMFTNATNSVQFVLRARVRFTWLTGPACYSQYFNVTLNTAKTFSVNGSSLGGSSYDANGHFRAVASDFTPPNMHSLATGCGTQGNRDAIGAAFFGPNAGPAAGDSGIKFDRGRIDTPAVIAP